jgi:FkbM family methyltransferase
MTPAEHPTFREFTPWRGRAPAGYDVNFVGQKTDIEFLRGSGWATPDRMVERDLQTRHRPADVETFEWLMLLDAVLEARRRFTMIELGAGYGRWLVGAACAARIRRPELDLKLVGVEAQPDHFRWMRQHFVDNGVDTARHRLIEAAVALAPGTTYLVDSPDPTGFWGQYVTADPNEIAHHVPGSHARPIRTVTLNEVMNDLSCVDLIDMDIQNAEREIVPANIKSLTERVRRMHIETHASKTHDICKQALVEAGWTILHSYELDTTASTPFGPIEICDGGILTAVNPKARSRDLISQAKYHLERLLRHTKDMGVSA